MRDGTRRLDPMTGQAHRQLADRRHGKLSSSAEDDCPHPKYRLSGWDEHGQLEPAMHDAGPSEGYPLPPALPLKDNLSSTRRTRDLAGNHYSRAAGYRGWH